MPIIQNTALARLRAGKLSIGFGAGALRTVATPMLARAAGFDWLFVDMEHGAFSINEATQLCIAALPTGVTPIVRVCFDALDEATRALDNGALGIVVPHVDTPAADSASPRRCAIRRAATALGAAASPSTATSRPRPCRRRRRPTTRSSSSP